MLFAVWPAGFLFGRCRQTETHEMRFCGAIQWQNCSRMDEMNFSALRFRYRTAFETYRNLVERSAHSAKHYERPSVEELRSERAALDALQEARRDLLLAVGAGFSGVN